MKRTEYMSITPSEKTCLSVSRRSCPKERDDLLESERSDVLNEGEIVDSQQEELHCAQAEEVQQRDQQLLQEHLLQQSLKLRQV